MRESVRPQTAHPPSRPAAEVTPTSPTVQHRSTRAEQPRGPLIPTHRGSATAPGLGVPHGPGHRRLPVVGGLPQTTSRQQRPESSKREPRAGAAPKRPGEYLFSTPVNAGAPLVGRNQLAVAGLYIQPYRASSAAIGEAAHRPPPITPTQAEPVEPRGDPVSSDPTQPLPPSASRQPAPVEPGVP